VELYAPAIVGNPSKRFAWVVETLSEIRARVGRRGGSAKTQAKVDAARANGKRGGRPATDINIANKAAREMFDNYFRNEHRYPIFIISKGRWKRPLTVRALERMPDVSYRIVVEPSEYDNYAKHLPDPRMIICAPEDFSKRGQGSIPVRNFVWDMAIKLGTARHWLMDDNIHQFFRLHQNMHHPVRTGAIFRAVEDFVDRYDNVPLAGLHNTGFVKRLFMLPPIVLNTRVYSCTLIQNDIPELHGIRWRGRYNEDTDLCLRVLKAGLCIMQFQAFTADKMQTMKMKGGNTDELYAGDGRFKMAQSLAEQHPDVATVGRRFNRWQHVVDYRPFKSNMPKLREGVVIREGTNEYGMRLVRVKPRTKAKP
jgi:hypothetical protein